MLLLSFGNFACNRPETGPDGKAGSNLPAPANDPTPADAKERHAVFAGGCFWCTEAVFEQLAGVSDVVSGYAGGKAETADYQAVSAGRTDHAEVIRITYDPSVISYGQLLRVFFATHNPTQLNAQGPDVGRRYRSAVFYSDENEKQVAADYIAQLTDAGAYDRPIVTTLEPLTTFYPAEAYHQDYVQHNPTQPYVAGNALPKVEKVRKLFPDLLKGNE